MGRSYKDELAELSTIRRHVPVAAAAGLAQQAVQASATGLIVVASGGAKVVAEWACRLHRAAFGSAAAAMTPLEYVTLPAPVRATTWLLSAGGRHPDIHQAAQVAKRRGDLAVTAIIGQSNTSLERWLTKELGAKSITLSLPMGVDGFLATNSVWAMVCALAQTYAAWLPGENNLNVSDCALDEVLQWAVKEAALLRHSAPGGRDLVVLHDMWCKLGAEDLEARLIEASLSNMWIADFRNFGHGRHFWAADRSDSTTLVALWTADTDDMAIPTLDLLPSALPCIRVRIPYVGVLGALASLAWSIHATAHWGCARSRDPGRPGIPAFGERLYEGKFPFPIPTAADPIRHSIVRKTGGCLPADQEMPYWRAGYDRAQSRLKDTPVLAVVLDYDGTLIESTNRYNPLEPEISAQLCRLLEAGMWIGVATGRGDSVQVGLQAAIPTHLRERVWVGYHNGAKVQPLDRSVEGLDGPPAGVLFHRACTVLENEVGASGVAVLRSRAFQLTLSPSAGQTVESIWKRAKECLTRHDLKAIDVWLSSHSVDVVAPDCSKLNVVSQIAHLAGCGAEDVLRIGDQGAWPGNDWRMLNAPLGLSVDQCSADIDSCWNFNPIGLRGTQATQYLLSRLQRVRRGMRLIFEEDTL